MILKFLEILDGILQGTKFNSPKKNLEINIILKKNKKITNFSFLDLGHPLIRHQIT